ncbi:MAG: cobalamin biosynthesis protein CobN, partial [Deltaproteobacteria bacterium]
DKMTQDWKKMPGELFVHDNELLFPGMLNGNIFLTIQPPRGYFEQIDKIYHDPLLSPPHHYLAHYRWIKHVFGAHAVLHVGKHGSLEWLPGKAVGLSQTCYPDLALMDLPNVYTYIINDPGEGTQAKRRSCACIVDHLPPVLANADLYEELADLDQLINDFQEAAITNPSKQSVMMPLIWDAVTIAHIDKDLNITKISAMADFKGFLEKVHGYLSQISDTTITKGLHILGSAPKNQDLIDTLVQLTRLSNSNIPSLRASIVKALGYNMDLVLENRGRILDPVLSMTGAHILEKVHRISLDMIQEIIAAKENNTAARIKKTMEKHLGSQDDLVFKALDYATGDLFSRILKTTNEISSCLAAFEGQFVPPGPSGAPSRGRADILPTGKNFYSVDPQKIPTPAAWKTGKKLADALVLKYQAEHNCYPDSVGIILWASPTMRTKGDDVAEILYLLGVKPVWQKGSGNVRGIEIIPLSKLGRPRIDVMPKISGIFRDAFPLIVDLIDKTIQQVAVLTEPFESNFIRRHVTRDMNEMASKGLDKESAFREATFRIFGAAPGSYGTGVTQLIESKKWETADDLGNIFIQWSSHAYGQKVFGQPSETGFRKALKRISVTVKNEDTREKDMMACTDFYGYHGGLISAVKSVQGVLPFSLAGDSSDPGNVMMRTTKEEANHVLRSRLLNPKWMQGLKAHGFKGAGDISKAMDIILGWDATAGVIDDFMYLGFARKTVLDKDIRAWMQKVNPYALQNILDKLLEANARGLWKTDPDTLEQLKETYLDVEGNIEDITA